MAKKFDHDAQRAIKLIEDTGITERAGVLVLIFGRRNHRVVGYLNDNPYNAARAMVQFLVGKYPHARRPAWLRRALAPTARGRPGAE